MSYEAKFSKNGNIKLGTSIWSFNKLAGNGVIAGCKGTCGEHCKGCYNPDNPQKSACYVFKSYVQYGWETGTPVRAHIRNTNAIRGNIDKAFEDIRLQLKRAKKKPTAVRIHSSGEIETTQEFCMWAETARQFSNIPFYIYTKSFKALDEMLEKYSNGKDMPSNLFINISIWHENGIKEYKKWQHLDIIRAFIYDDKEYDYTKELKIKFRCPAYKENGKMNHDAPCEKCKACFSVDRKICNCYSH